MSNDFGIIGFVRGDKFDAGVAVVNEHASQPAPQTRQRCDDYYLALTEIKTDTPELRAKVQHLLSQRAASNRAIEEFLLERAARDRVVLGRKRELAKRRVREIRKKIDDTKNKMFQLRNVIAACKNQTEAAFSELRDAKQAYPGRYATAAEIRKADAAVDAAQENVTRMQHAEAAPTIEHNRLAMDVMHKLSEELRKAEAEELDLELALSGRRGTNSLGIQV